VPDSSPAPGRVLPQATEFRMPIRVGGAEPRFHR
jgi:hypothetical protein